MTLNILPNAKSMFFDGNGNPLALGLVYMYVPTTTTFKDTWQDVGASALNTNPIQLDANGQAIIFGNGEYRQVVKDSLGNLIWDQITVDPGYQLANSFHGTSTSSVLIGTGTKTFTTQPGLQFFAGGTLVIASDASALNYMNGFITSYNTSTGVLVMNIVATGGSGTHADWNISVSGLQGPSGTVTAVSVASSNGFAGSSTGGGAPQLTLSTTVTGVLKGNGTAISAATAGTDYSAGTYLLPTGILKSTTTTGALDIAIAADFPTLNQNTTGTAAHVTTNANLTGPVTSVGNATTIQPSVVTEAMQSLSDNTTNNVSTSKHGYVPKAPGDATKFLDGSGAYSVPVTSPLVGTSTTSLAVAMGSTVFTTQAGLSIGNGQFLIAVSAADATNYMFGTVTSYSGTTLTINVTAISGSGTHADWNIFSSGPQGASGSGSVSNVSVVSANGLAGSVADPTTTPAITLTLGAITPSTVNALTLASQSIGFTIAGGTTSKTLTVPLSATVSGTNTGDQTITLTGDVTGTGTGSFATTVAKIAGTTVIGTTGSGNVAFSTSPTFVTPDLGTPSAGVMTNATGTAASLTAGTATVANGLKSATTTVSVSAATAPSSGQVLTATASTTATWQTPSSSIPTALGVGSIIFACYGVNGTISAGSTTAAANLATATIKLTAGPTFNIQTAGDTLAGTWQALMTTVGGSGSVGANNSVYGLFQRTV